MTSEQCDQKSQTEKSSSVLQNNIGNIKVVKKQLNFSLTLRHVYVLKSNLDLKSVPRFVFVLYSH